MNTIQKAISLLGGPTAAAAKLGETPQAWCFRRDGERGLPAELCPTIELHLYGQDQEITCENLLPEKPWLRIKDKRWPNPSGRPVLDWATRAEPNTA